jgi:hypothetical protein
VRIAIGHRVNDREVPVWDVAAVEIGRRPLDADRRVGRRTVDGVVVVVGVVVVGVVVVVDVVVVVVVVVVVELLVVVEVLGAVRHAPQRPRRALFAAAHRLNMVGRTRPRKIATTTRSR